MPDRIHEFNTLHSFAQSEINRVNSMGFLTLDFSTLGLFSQAGRRGICACLLATAIVQTSIADDPVTVTAENTVAEAVAVPAGQPVANPLANPLANPITQPSASANSSLNIVIDPKLKQRRATAVALNYCRASFHRIRRTSSQAVLNEEQARILNNLDLNGVADEAVIKLYSSLLNEISQFDIAKRERALVEQTHQRDLQRQLATDLFAIGTDVATAQVGSAIRSGANSWWDIRSKNAKKTENVWRIERNNMKSLVSHSSDFLNAFWKLSRDNDIPDNWLIREMDLDRMDLALRERNPEVRLRVLNRMSKFMSCYPPYYYYVARTQQELGNFSAAAETYERLSEVGDGFFRNDDMMAAGLANLALIQQQQSNPNAVRTALAALQKSNRVWEANLASAWVLSRNSDYVSAEDALLRNLDVDLESINSTRSLVSLYYFSGNRPKLARLIGRRDVARLIPVPGLLMCAGLLGSDKMPDVATQQLAQSMYGHINLRSNGGDVSIVASPGWQLSGAQMTLRIGDRRFTSPRVNSNGKQTEARFLANSTSGQATGDQSRQPIELALKWKNTPEVTLNLNSPQEAQHQTFRAPNLVSHFGLPRHRDSRFRLSSVAIGDVRLSMEPVSIERQ